jgi:hypothetical protein
MERTAFCESRVGSATYSQEDNRNNEPFHARLHSMPRDETSIWLVGEQRLAEQ